ncbi:MAG TPA: hypothetical protein VIN59_01210 [Alphaproteobacteria bacterium]
MNPETLRRAEFITPANTLKAKLGSGGLDENVLEQAQKLVDDAGIDFLPTGQRYLVSLQEAIRLASVQSGNIDDEALIATMIYPAMQLKGNGGMFGYPLVTLVAGKLVQFLEMIRTPDEDALDIVGGFAAAIQAIMLLGEKAAEVAEHGEDLSDALDDACRRYFEKYI